MKILFLMFLFSNSYEIHHDIGILQTGVTLISNNWIEFTKYSVNKNENVTIDFRTISTSIDTPSLKSIRKVNEFICSNQLTLLISTDVCAKTIETLLPSNFPVIRINSSAECDKTRRNSFNLPNTLTTAEILLKLMKSLNMEACSIFIDMSTREYLLYKILDAIRHLNIRCKIINIKDSDDDEDLRDYIESTEKNNLQIFKASTFKTRLSKNNNILLCSLRNIERLIDQINYIEKYRMLTKGAIYHNRWLIIEEGAIENILLEVAKKIKDVDNFAALSIMEPKYVTLESRFQDAVFKLYKVLEGIYDDPSYTTSTSSCDAYYADIFNDLLRNTFDTKECSRFKMYHFPPYSKKFEETLFCDNDLQSLNFDVFPNEKYGFNGRKMVVATLPFAPFVKKKTVKGKLVYSGVCIDLLNEFAYLLNFTYDIIEPADQQWGKQLQNGSYTGLVGIMQKQEADLLFAPLSVTDARRKVMDFSTPYYFEYSSALIKLPGENEGKWKVITEPFRWEVWLCIVMSVPFTGVIAWIITKISLYLMNGTPLFMEDIFRIWDKSMWYVFGALLTQGGAYQPRTMPGRTVIAFWWCFSIVMVATYSGNLIAFLTVSKQEIPFNSLSTLVETSNYKWGLMGGTFYEDHLKNVTDPILKEFYTKMREFYEEDKSILDIVFSNHIEKVKNEKYTLISDKTSLEYEVIQDCSLSTIKDKFLSFPYAIGMQKGSHFFRELDELLLSLRSGGIIQFWHNKHWPKDKGCTSLNQPTSKPVTILDVQSAFYILLGGLFISLLILIYELIRQKYFPEKLTSKTIKIEINSKEENIEKKLNSQSNETVVTRHKPKMNNLFLPD
ncbi:DgyrCDS2882 [Dimorphilus gyrociliatus]|uniref:DgyrCDS2882 n=1 Tax=Dimorphilus gyrociliatus TaxID=2664684 RepID=A0A7I8VEL2_9ANNE|nr:DgyrCDS2882 [Dimorphilus gyrociliatus]